MVREALRQFKQIDLLFDRTSRAEHSRGMGRMLCLAGIAGAWLVGTCNADADGCFVFHWNKGKDINEPTQKVIILHDNGREDMVLQVKYEGPTEDFGWLIPVPGLPEVRKGSMDCFYELSRLTQRRFPSGSHLGDTATPVAAGPGEEEAVKVIEVKSVGAYEVVVLSATNAASLGEWLDAHQFAFPREKQNILDEYVKKRWCFVAAKIDLTQSGFVIQGGPQKRGPDKAAVSSSTRKKLASGELYPLVLSFSSGKCVFPLAISAVNGKPSEVSLYVMSAEPLVSRIIFDKRFAAYSRERADWIQKAPERRKEGEAKRDVRLTAMRKKREEDMKRLGPSAGASARFSPMGDDDPADPRPSEAGMRQLLGTEGRMMFSTESEEDFFGGLDLVQSLEVGPKDIPECSKEMPRLVGKTWWLTKLVEEFAPDEMRDLEFEPAVPILAGKLGTAEGQEPAFCLAQFGGLAVPALLSGLKSFNPIERRQVAFALGGYASSMGPIKDSRLAAVVPGLLADADARNRRDGCCSARVNWDANFAPRLRELLGDTNKEVRSAARFCLGEHRDENFSQDPVYLKMVKEDGLAASDAITLLDPRSLSREQLVHLFSSTNLPVVSTAFSTLRYQNLEVKEIEPLLTNSLPMARMMGLGALTKIADKAVVDRIVAMLRDPNEAVRWNVRARLRLLTGQKLGSDPAAYEKWWAEHQNNFTPRPPRGPG
jgi:hypothetical protein